jgi:hypothetical protein
MTTTLLIIAALVVGTIIGFFLGACFVLAKGTPQDQRRSDDEQMQYLKNFEKQQEWERRQRDQNLHRTTR